MSIVEQKKKVKELLHNIRNKKKEKISDTDYTLEHEYRLGEVIQHLQIIRDHRHGDVSDSDEAFAEGLFTGKYPELVPYRTPLELLKYIAIIKQASFEDYLSALKMYIIPGSEKYVYFRFPQRVDITAAIGAGNKRELTLKSIRNELEQNRKKLPTEREQTEIFTTLFRGRIGLLKEKDILDYDLLQSVEYCFNDELILSYMSSIEIKRRYYLMKYLYTFYKSILDNFDEMSRDLKKDINHYFFQKVELNNIKEELWNAKISLGKLYNNADEDNYLMYAILLDGVTNYDDMPKNFVDLYEEIYEKIYLKSENSKSELKMMKTNIIEWLKKSSNKKRFVYNLKKFLTDVDDFEGAINFIMDNSGITISETKILKLINILDGYKSEDISEADRDEIFSFIDEIRAWLIGNSNFHLSYMIYKISTNADILTLKKMYIISLALKQDSEVGTKKYPFTDDSNFKTASHIFLQEIKKQLNNSTRVEDQLINYINGRNISVSNQGLSKEKCIQFYRVILKNKAIYEYLCQINNFHDDEIFYTNKYIEKVRFWVEEVVGDEGYIAKMQDDRLMISEDEKNKLVDSIINFTFDFMNKYKDKMAD